MYTKQLPYVMVAATPVHAGSGTELGIVDLPIQREKHTNHPKIESSTIKGALRNLIRRQESLDSQEMDLIMGPEEGDLNQAALGLMDARLLFFPVKSIQGVFALVTCQDVLEGFTDTLHMAGIEMKDNEGRIDLSLLPDNCVTEHSTITMDMNDERLDVVIEETLLRDVEKSRELSRLAIWFGNQFLSAAHLSTYKNSLNSRLLLVDNNTFSNLVELYTEVVARNRIDPETGTVKKGQLWYEEYLPVESTLYSVLAASQPFAEEPPEDLTDADAVLSKITSGDAWPDVLQIGGNQSIGKGFMKMGLYSEEG